MRKRPAVAEESTTGTKQSVEVKPTYGLADEDIERMLLDAYEHGEEDGRRRRLTEERVAMMRDKVAATISAGDHGTTYGGNLLACRAALVVLDELDGGLQAAIRRTSAHLFAGLRALRSRHTSIVDVRGAGQMAGV